tara:strand:+ start:393 stop:1031 length:639 start_codon:yes stop_codon:yes gene_type:complete
MNEIDKSKLYKKLETAPFDDQPPVGGKHKRESQFYDIYPEMCEFLMEKAGSPWSTYFMLKARYRRRMLRDQTRDNFVYQFFNKNVYHNIIGSFMIDRFWRAMEDRTANVGVIVDEIYDEIGKTHPTKRTIREYMEEGVQLGIFGETRSKHNKKLLKYYPTKIMIEHFIQYYRQEFLFLEDNNIGEIGKGLRKRLKGKPDSGQYKRIFENVKE